MGAWDATTAGQSRGCWMVRYAGRDSMMVSVLPHVDRAQSFVDAFVDRLNELDDVESEAAYRAAGWQTRAEHDEAWAAAVARARAQPLLVRNHLNDRWQLDGYAGRAAAGEVLSTDDYLTWTAAVDVACEPEGSAA